MDKSKKSKQKMYLNDKNYDNKQNIIYEKEENKEIIIELELINYEKENVFYVIEIN